MRRREFIGFLGGATTWPLAARAQQAAMPVIGFLGSPSLATMGSRVAEFREGLKEIGFVEGQNLAIEYRWANGQYDRLSTLAADLARQQVAVIAAMGGPAAKAAKAATTTIPIVFAMANDPIQLGLVASLNRPGGNLTGVTNLNLEVGPKRLELLHEAIPKAGIVAVLVNPTNPNAATQSRDLQPAARTLGLEAHVLHASAESDFDETFATVIRLRAGGLVIDPDTLFNIHSERLAALAMRYAVPAIYQFRAFATAGGLMSYGSSPSTMYRQAGLYTGRILKGEKPDDLPVQQSTKVELIINLKTARALGLEVPPTLLARADEVIE
jgi:putative tryptophan/tyrosine transport system substrate-binding protein